VTRFARLEIEAKPSWCRIDPNGIAWAMSSDPTDATGDTGQHHTAETMIRLPPAVPSKIVGVGLNYVDHAHERGRKLPDAPLLFLKPPSALVGHGSPILLPNPDHDVHYEAELAVVIGKRCRHVDKGSWRDVVLGFTCANDVSDRVLQQRDGQFTRGKGFDTFCPLGPDLVTEVDVSDLKVTCRVNGETRQSASTSDMLFDVPTLVAFVSSIMTLEPYDVILTGTPSGVGSLAPGDRVEVEIDGIGKLENPVVGLQGA